MPWREVSALDLRREFVRLALQDGVNRRQLCRRFGISPDVGYNGWLGIWRATQTSRIAPVDRAEAQLDAKPQSRLWRWLCAMLIRPGAPARSHAAFRGRGVPPPAVSTVHAILRRPGRVDPPAGKPGQPYQRFEMEAPNLLWQMDFKGHMPLGDGASCHPLTVIDDHSRYALCLAACANEQGGTVRTHLETAFRLYGLPEAMFVDNGAPWGFTRAEPWTRLGVWLLKLGVRLIHSRPDHPQSRGKNERFHRTLKAEVFAFTRFKDLTAVQRAFDHQWRALYNLERPHEALDQDVPINRYRPSPRTMPESLPEVEYDADERVRSVSTTKAMSAFKGRLWKVPQAFCGERLAIRPLNVDGKYGVFLAAHQVATIDLTGPQTVSHVSEQL